MSLPSKTVRCDCGNTLNMTGKTDWCRKCGRQVFYYSKDKRRAILNTCYMYTMLILGVLMVLYFTYEFAKPMQ